MSNTFEARDNWEALFDHNYLRWFNLNDQPSLVEITSVERGVELTMRGGIKTKKPVIGLKQLKGAIEEIKPLVLNVTNGNAIALLHGPKPSEWVGKQIVLFPATTKMYDGETKKMLEVGCIRIRGKKE
jgi:hypothetical protein